MYFKINFSVRGQHGFHKWEKTFELKTFHYLRTVPPKLKGFYVRIGLHGKSRSLQGLLESTKTTGVAMHFCEIVSLVSLSQQKC